jgi:hypothetical protein
MKAVEVRDFYAAKAKVIIRRKRFGPGKVFKHGEDNRPMGMLTFARDFDSDQWKFELSTDHHRN